MLTAFVSGAALSGSLIVALGAQNLFVLRQGLHREFVGPVVFTCILIDASLMAMGVFGVARATALHPDALRWVTLAGCAFLFCYGAVAARRAVWPGLIGEVSAPVVARSRALVVGQVLAVSLLNPHVYLDTVFLVGAVGTSYAMPERALFWGGASAMSVIWFVALGFGARWLRPIFAQKQAWRWLDGATAVTMWVLAVMLLRSNA